MLQRAQRKRRGGGAGGFTLLEVLVGLALFAWAAVVLGAAYVNVLNSYRIIGEHGEFDQDLRVVRSHLLLEPDLEKAEEGGEVRLPGERVAQWHAEVEPAQVADLFHVLFACEIRAPEREEPFSFEQRLTLLRPSWSDPIERDAILEESRQRLEQWRRNWP